MSDEPETEAPEYLDVKYEFKTSEDHQEVFANRVAGGWENGLTLAMHFLVENTSLPDAEVRRHFRDGRVEILERDEQENTQVRKRMVTVHMPLDEVQDFKEWLEQQLEDLRRANLQANGGESDDEKEDEES